MLPSRILFDRRRVEVLSLRGGYLVAVDVGTAAEHVGVAQDSVYRWIQRKDLPPRGVGRHWSARFGDAHRWVVAGGTADGLPDQRSGS